MLEIDLGRCIELHKVRPGGKGRNPMEGKYLRNKAVKKGKHGH